MMAAMKNAALVLALGACAGGCLDPDLSGTRDVVVISTNGAGEYALRARSVTADDFTTLEGDSVRFLAKPSLVIDEFTETIELSGGEDMHVTYSEVDGELVATDYLGLIAVTAYHHMQATHSYFHMLGLGSTADELPQQRVLFLPKIRVNGGGRVVANDNMAYIPELESFMVLAEDILDELPLAANEGVVGHEFSHAVLHALTDGPDGTAANVRLGWDTESSNFWASLHEGLADVHGVAITGESNFVAPSVSSLFGDRDAASLHQLTDSMLFDVGSFAGYDPYPMGSVIAATFWTYHEGLRELGVGEDQALADMGRLAFDAARTLQLGSEFHIADYLTSAANATPDAASRDAWCTAVGQHFVLVQDLVTGCP